MIRSVVGVLELSEVYQNHQIDTSGTIILHYAAETLLLDKHKKKSISRLIPFQRDRYTHRKYRFEQYPQSLINLAKDCKFPRKTSLLKRHCCVFKETLPSVYHVQQICYT